MQHCLCLVQVSCIRVPAIVPQKGGQGQQRALGGGVQGHSFPEALLCLALLLTAQAEAAILVPHLQQTALQLFTTMGWSTLHKHTCCKPLCCLTATNGKSFLQAVPHQILNIVSAWHTGDKLPSCRTADLAVGVAVR